MQFRKWTILKNLNWNGEFFPKVINFFQNRIFTQDQFLQIVDALRTRKKLKRLKMKMEGSEDTNNIIPQIMEKLGIIQSLEELNLKIFRYHCQNPVYISYLEIHILVSLRHLDGLGLFHPI